MTRICKNCSFENQDDYDYCAKCGTPLVEGVQPRQFYVYRQEMPQINKKAISDILNSLIKPIKSL